MLKPWQEVDHHGKRSFGLGASSMKETLVKLQASTAEVKGWRWVTQHYGADSQLNDSRGRERAF